MICVVDASVAVKWFAHGDWATREDHIEPATALLLASRNGTVDFYQPPHFLAEVAAVLSRLTPHTAIQSVQDLAAMSFTPTEVAAEIKKHIPQLEVTYAPDFRQKIADSWPASIDDSRAREDWGWNHQFDLETMTAEMLKNLAPQYNTDLQ